MAAERRPSEEDQPQVQSEPRPPFPAQHQPKPGSQAALRPRPRDQAARYRPAEKLRGKVALVTGGDSGIGRAVCRLYAKEGANLCFTYLPEEEQDAQETRRAIEAEGCRCVMIAGDLADPAFCRKIVDRCINELGRLDVLVHNAAHQNRKHSLDEMSDKEWHRTFAVNIDAYFHLTRAAVPHMPPGSAIIATSSETGMFGERELPDYAATKGAIIAFTKSLAQMLIGKGIRVNTVAPGPVWTPLNPADEGMPAEQVRSFGADVPMGRPAQPEEIAPAYVFLASDADSSYITGTVLPELGGVTGSG